MVLNEKKVVSVDGFCLKKGNFQLKNIALGLYEKEIVAVLGKTGSGKTLLLESIAGYYKGSCGSVKLGEKSVTEIPLQERKIGFVYQDYGLFPHMTVEKNIGYGLRMQKYERNEIRHKVQNISEIFGISHMLNQDTATLSGGEKQRTAL
ncbi:MAG: ATP-binding cassette domain-containing protein, partial [Anaerovorax sp.]